MTTEARASQTSDVASKRGRWLHAFAIATVLVAVAAYARLLFSVSANLPYLDDFDVILDFLNRYAATDSGSERLGLLFEQHVEHRMAFLRELAVLSYHAQDGVDFHTLNVFGSGGLLVLAALLYVGFRGRSSLPVDSIAFLPAPLLLFHPQFWDCLLWPTSSLANFWVVAFTLGALLLLARASRLAFTGAMLCALLAVFCQGNGMLVLPLGALLLLAPQRRTRLAIWCVASAVVLALYFRGYVPPEGPGMLAGLLSGWDPIAYALNLIGSAPSFTTRGLAFWLGAAGIASAIALVWRGYPKRNPPLFLLLLFVIGSIGANALGRSQLAGPLYPLHSPRYQFFSCVFWAVTYLAWAELAGARSARLLVGAAVPASIGFAIASFSLYQDDVELVSQRLRRGMLAWTTQRRGLVYPDVQRADAILQRAIELGVYRVPIDDLLTSTPIEKAPAERPGKARIR